MTHSITDLVRGMRDTRLATLPVLLIAIVAAGIGVFLSIAHEMGEGEIDALDTRLLLMLRNPADPSDPIGPPWLEEAALEITALGGYPVIVLTLAVVIGYLLMAKKLGPALYVFLSVSVGTLLSQAMKRFYDRPRPDIVAHLDVIHTASFPSGHAMMSTVAYLTLATLIVRLVDDFRVRAYVMSVAIAVSVLVGISRVYLGVHWPSDVAAGWALGAAWASFSWLVVSALRRLRRQEEAAAPASGG